MSALRRVMTADRYLVVFVGCSALVRALVYLALPSGRFGEIGTSTAWYFDALRNQFADYLWLTTLKAPLTYVVQAAVLAVFGAELTYERHLFLVVVFILDICASLLVYSGARRLGAGRSFAVALAAVFSFGLVPFELWRLGDHYDHLTIFFTTLFAYALIRWWSEPGLRSATGVAISGALLIAQSASNLYAVPVAVAVALASGRSRAQAGVLARSALIALAIPVLVGAAIVAKNYVAAGVMATSNQTGPAIMLFVHEAAKDLPGGQPRLLDEAGVPDWYRWCHDHPVNPPEAAEDPNWTVLARAFGICFPWSPVDGPSWPFDLTALRTRLAEAGETRLVELVDRDIADMRDRRNLLSGFSPEQSPRWIGAYGQVSVRMFTTLVTRHPVLFLRTSARVNAQYAARGPLISVRTLIPIEDVGMRTLPMAVPAEPVFFAAARAFGAVTGFAYLALHVALVLSLVAAARRSRTITVAERWAVLTLAAPTIVLSQIFVLAAFDLDRYFIQVTPYLFLAVVPIAAMTIRAFRRVRERA